MDGPTLFVRRHFNDQFLHFKVNVNIVDIASVGGVVAAVSDTGRLYNMTIFGGSPVFKDITHTFSKKFAKMKSVSVWRSEGRRCFVDLMKPFFAACFVEYRYIAGSSCYSYFLAQCDVHSHYVVVNVSVTFTIKVHVG